MKVRDGLEDKFMLFVHFKKALSLTLLGHSFERRAYWLLFRFETYHGIPYSYTGKVDRGWWTLCEWLKLILRIRDYSFYLSGKNRNLACISNKQVINCWICFFIGVVVKLAVLVSWHNSSSILVLTFWTASEALAPYS